MAIKSYSMITGDPGYLLTYSKPRGLVNSAPAVVAVQVSSDGYSLELYALKSGSAKLTYADVNGSQTVNLTVGNSSPTAPGVTVGVGVPKEPNRIRVVAD